MKSLQILIVEDEVLIAEFLKLNLLERGHQVTNIALSFDEALEAFHLRRPDLILLDIRLYGLKSGIDFAAYISEQKNAPPYIYLTSQYDQRILSQALETNPYGYLTKPIKKETLWTTLESAYNLHISKNTEEKIIYIQDGKNNYHLKVGEIIYIQADHVYLNIILSDETTLTIRQTLKKLLSDLSEEQLVQCHRSYIINRMFIKSWNSTSITLKNNKQIPISRSFKPF